jgi:prevent-host-death family protein
MTSYTINSREARKKMREVLDSVYLKDQDVVIERNGKPIAAIIPLEDYLALKDELEDLRAGREADREYAKWKAHPESAVSLEDFEAELKHGE